MTMYDDVRAKVEMLGGSVGPAGVGSINLTGGAEIKIRYDVPGPGVRVASIVPYLIGSDQTSRARTLDFSRPSKAVGLAIYARPRTSGAAGLEMFQD